MQASPPTSRPVWQRHWTPLFLAKPIPPVRISNLYRLGLLGVAFTLILLQVFYLSLVALLAWATYSYAIYIPEIFSAVRINFLTIPLTIAPLAAGVVSTFFLLKPLLSRSKKPEDLLVLHRDQEPHFFEFVDRLCAMVGSPAPSRIALDLEVNASARLNRGWWSLITGDLALTVGLPLVEGCTLRQFSGVLAHEFGHFSQKAGLRLHFLIATSRHWFARVAYERDQWDERLDEWGQDAGWRTKLVLGLANASVAASRAILRGLLKLGDRVSTWFSRQMEFDADLHEAGLVGEEVFRQTTIRLAEINIASQRAWRSVDQAWQRSQLPTDFPHLVGVIERDALGMDRQLLEDSLLEQETDRWSTHPSPQDRLLNVRGCPGVVPTSGPWGADVPASILFHHFETLSEKTTTAHYGVTLAEHFSEAALQPGAEFAIAQSENWQHQDARQSYFGKGSLPGRWFRFSETADPRLVVSEEEPDADYWAHLQQWLNRSAGLNYLQSGGEINPTGFDLSTSDLKEAEIETADSFVKLTAEILRLRKTFEGISPMLAKNPLVVEAYQLLSSEQEKLLDLRSALMNYRVLTRNIHLLTAVQAENARTSAIDAMQTLRKSIESNLHTNPLLLSRWLAPSGSNEEDNSATLLDWTDHTSDHLLGKLCLEANSY
jgi:Zn-dependent protease with chaperone function